MLVQRSTWMLAGFAIVLGLGMTAVAPSTANPTGAAAAVKAPVVPPKGLDGEEALKKAKSDGKYEMLLAQIKVEDDWNTFGEYKDLGIKGRKEYKGHKKLPRGHWVYVFPYWYIFRDETATAKQVRGWGPEQAVGEPNAVQGQDSSAAWASLSADGQDEWLLLEYAEPVAVKSVEVHETYAPGALVKVTAFKLDGAEVEIWKGQDPTAAGNLSGVSKLDVKCDFKTSRIKLYIDSKNVLDWNEIDAVGLVDDLKKTHWAASAEASSTYARDAAGVQEDPRFSKLEEKIDALESEIQEMHETIKKLKALLEKKGS